MTRIKYLGAGIAVIHFTLEPQNFQEFGYSVSFHLSSNFGSANLRVESMPYSDGNGMSLDGPERIEAFADLHATLATFVREASAIVALASNREDGIRRLQAMVREKSL